MESKNEKPTLNDAKEASDLLIRYFKDSEHFNHWIHDYAYKIQSHIEAKVKRNGKPSQ